MNDLAAATEFWRWLLGADVIREVGDFGIHLGPPGRPAMRALQRVEEPKSGKNRMHLDMMADDIDTVAAEIEAPGGSWVAGLHEAPGGVLRWFVMTDPEGNEFCLSTPVPGI